MAKEVETYLAKFDKLSDKRKQEIRKELQDELKKAEANKNRPLTSRILDTLTEIHPLMPKNVKETHRKIASEDMTARSQRYAAAKKRASMSDVELGKEQRLYSDDKPHKVNPNEPMFRKGGAVKKPAMKKGKR